MRGLGVTAIGRGLAAALVLGLAPAAATAQDPGSTPLPEQPGAEGVLPEEAQNELDRALQLTLPQQKERARELIRKYPGTRVARIAQRLLDEYAAFERLSEGERAARAAQIAFVREYWRAKVECQLPEYTAPVGRLVNEGDEPAVFQIRFRQTVWMGPYRLRPGQEQIVYEPVLVRRFVAGAFVEEPLAPGNTIDFHETGAATAAPAVPVPAGDKPIRHGTEPAPIENPAPEAEGAIDAGPTPVLPALPL